MTATTTTAAASELELRLVYGDALIPLITHEELPHNAGAWHNRRSKEPAVPTRREYSCRLPLPMPDSAALVLLDSSPTGAALHKGSADRVRVSGSMHVMVGPDLPLVNCGTIEAPTSFFAQAFDLRLAKRTYHDRLAELTKARVTCKFVFNAEIYPSASSDRGFDSDTSRRPIESSASVEQSPLSQASMSSPSPPTPMNMDIDLVSPQTSTQSKVVQRSNSKKKVPSFVRRANAKQDEGGAIANEKTEEALQEAREASTSRRRDQKSCADNDSDDLAVLTPPASQPSSVTSPNPRFGREETPYKTGNVGKVGPGSRTNSASAALKRAKVTKDIFPEEDGAPSGRWGHSMALDAAKNTLYLFGGMGTKGFSTDLFWKYSLNDQVWRKIHGEGKPPSTRMGHSSVFDAESGCFYVVGGAKNKRFFRDIQKFDFKKNAWSNVEVLGGKGPALSYHSCVLFHKILMVFGGNFPRPDPIPDGCSEHLHCFDIEKQLWYKPILVGSVPSARSGHSCTVVGDDVYIFGGWDAPECYNDVFKMDFTLMESQRIDTSGEAPTARTWHVAIATKTRDGHDAIFVHGGFDGNDVLDDAYLLDLVTLQWSKISDSYTGRPCAGHAALQLTNPLATSATDVVVFGGGDNDERFYDTLGQWRLSFA